MSSSDTQPAASSPSKPPPLPARPPASASSLIDGVIPSISASDPSSHPLVETVTSTRQVVRPSPGGDEELVNEGTTTVTAAADDGDKEQKGAVWFKKLVDKGTASIRSRKGSVGKNDGEENPVVEVDFADAGAEGEDQFAEGGAIGRGAPAVRDNASTKASSIKSKILSEHTTKPSTSDEEFHELFGEATAEDELIEDYRCALVKDILIQGRLFVSEQHLAFHASIFGLVTHLLVPFSTITSLEKRNTAKVIPNAISITTSSPIAGHPSNEIIIASLLHRDATYDLITAIWRHVNPSLAQEAAEDPEREEASVTPDGRSEMSYTDDRGDKKKYRFGDGIRALKQRIRSKSVSSAEGDEGGKTEAEKIKDNALAKDGGRGEHKETKYEGEEFETVAMDEKFPTSPELLWGILNGSEAKEFLTEFLDGKMGVKDLEIGDWVDDQREVHYDKPLHSSVGPKSALCNIKDVIEHQDPEKYYSLFSTTSTPNVPSGNGFIVKTRTVITWSNVGGARMRVTTEVEWSKVNRMLKGIIERSSIEGQKTYHKDLEEILRKRIASNPKKYGLKGLSTDSSAAAKPTAPDDASPVSLSFGDYVPSLTTLLVILTVFLLVTNFWTLVALRHQARAAHEARLGTPGEVAEVVRGALGRFEERFERRGEVKIDKEVEGLLVAVKGLEEGLGEVRRRLEGLKW
ncbi:gram domain protein [Pseudohyphozyma bogoriensis]|nr:gram domain protein [Pseudohyphozyma bogoriensis]